MALNATIYKFTIALSDLNRNLYESFALTVAQHPSETHERMLARIIAYCCHYSSDLEFTKGLSTPETPDIWQKSLDGQILQWIELGEPAFDKVKKATRQAQSVKVYSYSGKSDVWWGLEQNKWKSLRLQVIQLPWAVLVDMTKSIERTMSLAVTLSEGSIYVDTGTHHFELEPVVLREA